MYCESKFSHNVERSEYSLRSGHHPGSWTRASIVAPCTLHLLATVSASSRVRDLVERNSPALCPDAPPALRRSPPTRRARSLPDSPNGRLPRRDFHGTSPPPTPG